MVSHKLMEKLDGRQSLNATNLKKPVAEISLKATRGLTSFSIAQCNQTLSKAICRLRAVRIEERRISTASPEPQLVAGSHLSALWKIFL